MEDSLFYSEIVKNNLYVAACEVLGGSLILSTANSLFFSGFALGLILKTESQRELGLESLYF